jgi:predicted ribosomally synthesized peptide with nif11-like leader
VNNINQFFEKLQADSKLQEKLQAIQGKTQEEVMEAVIALAKENHFEVTKEDFLKATDAAKEAAPENIELDEAELDAVAGGGAVEWGVASVASFGIACLVSMARGNRCSLDTVPYTGDGD